MAVRPIQQGAFRTFKGIAPNANILDLRVLDQNGASSDSVVIAAIQKAVQLKSQYNVRVINLSLGREVFESCSQDPLCQAVEAAWKSGIVVVVAAGNEGRNGYGTILSPGSAPHAITVGAMKTEETMTTSDDRIASYSSRGPTNVDLIAKPDVVAPGNLVDSLLAPGSTLVNEYPGNIVPASSYTTASVSGTPLYFTVERNQHGDPGGFGRGGIDDREGPKPHSGYRQSAPDEDRFEDVPGDEHRDRSDHRPDLHGLLRHVHRGRRIRGHGRRADQLRARSTVRPRRRRLLYNSLLGTALLVPNLTETWWSTPNWFTSVVWGPVVLVPGQADNGDLGQQRFLGHQRFLGDERFVGNQRFLGDQRFLGHQRFLGYQCFLGHRHTRRAVNQTSGPDVEGSNPNSRGAWPAKSICSDTSVWASRRCSGPWRTGSAAIRSAWYLSSLATALGSVLKLQLPGVRGMVSVSALFMLVGIVNLSLSEALLVGAVSMIVQCTWRTAARPKLLQTAFNVSVLCIAVMIAARVFDYSHSHFLPEPVSLALLALAYFCANTFPIAAIIGLTEGKRIFSVWSNYRWTLAYYAVGASMAWVIGTLPRGIQWEFPIICLPLVYLVHRSNRTHLVQMEQERTHMHSHERFAPANH